MLRHTYYMTSSLISTDPIREDRRRRNELYGPPPINIFTELREARNYSIQLLSVKSHIDPMALKRSEAGTYTNPLPSLVEYWVRTGTISEGEINVKYADYVDAQRKRHQRYFGPNLQVDYLSDDHPFRQLRSRRPSLVTNRPLPVGPTECAQAMCVPLDTIQFFEKKYATQQSVPKPIKVALNQMGYTQTHIANFENFYKHWRENQLKKQVTFK